MDDIITTSFAMFGPAQTHLFRFPSSKNKKDAFVSGAPTPTMFPTIDHGMEPQPARASDVKGEGSNVSKATDSSASCNIPIISVTAGINLVLDHSPITLSRGLVWLQGLKKSPWDFLVFRSIK